MKKVLKKEKKQLLRKGRIKAKIFRGGITRPRLNVSKSNKHLFLQIIDDIKGVTLLSIHDNQIKGKDKKMMEKASEMGKLLAEKAITKDIKKIVFDRNKFAYHGIVKAVAEGAREGGNLESPLRVDLLKPVPSGLIGPVQLRCAE